MALPDPAIFLFFRHQGKLSVHSTLAFLRPASLLPLASIDETDPAQPTSIISRDALLFYAGAALPQNFETSPRVSVGFPFFVLSCLSSSLLSRLVFSCLVSVGLSCDLFSLVLFLLSAYTFFFFFFFFSRSFSSSSSLLFSSFFLLRVAITSHPHTNTHPQTSIHTHTTSHNQPPHHLATASFCRDYANPFTDLPSFFPSFASSN